jgi:YhcH/YjgK/YiaL family protein
MILDRLEYVEFYVGNNTKLYRALMFARDFNPLLPDGSYEIDGSEIYAFCRTYTTKRPENNSFENHKSYIDVQVVLQGEETIGHTVDSGLVPKAPYDEASDKQKYLPPVNYTRVHFEPGSFVVFFPHDYHMPDCTAQQPTRNRKLVVKVKI